jgi:hypothetical protein
LERSQEFALPRQGITVLDISTYMAQPVVRFHSVTGGLPERTVGRLARMRCWGSPRNAHRACAHIDAPIAASALTRAGKA